MSYSPPPPSLAAVPSSADCENHENQVKLQLMTPWQLPGWPVVCSAKHPLKSAPLSQTLDVQKVNCSSKTRSGCQNTR